MNTCDMHDYELEKLPDRDGAEARDFNANAITLVYLRIKTTSICTDCG